MKADPSLVDGAFPCSENSLALDLSLREQLDNGVRAFHFPFHTDGFASHKEGFRIGKDVPGDAITYSSPDLEWLDNQKTLSLELWLGIIARWSAGHEDEAPITIFLEPRCTELHKGRSQRVGNLAALNWMLERVFGKRLATPALVGARTPLSELRGKVLAVLSGPWKPKSRYVFDKGTEPAICANKAGVVVEVHEDTHNGLWYWTGRLEKGGTIAWLNHGFYDSGVHPSVSINDANVVVEVHKSEMNYGLFCTVGEYHPDTRDIRWFKAIKFGMGRFPTVAVNNLKMVAVSYKGNTRELIFAEAGVLSHDGGGIIVNWASKKKRDNRILDYRGDKPSIRFPNLNKPEVETLFFASSASKAILRTKRSISGLVNLGPSSAEWEIRWSEGGYTISAAQPYFRSCIFRGEEPLVEIISRPSPHDRHSLFTRLFGSGQLHFVAYKPLMFVEFGDGADDEPLRERANAAEDRQLLFVSMECEKLPDSLAFAMLWAKSKLVRCRGFNSLKVKLLMAKLPNFLSTERPGSEWYRAIFHQAPLVRRESSEWVKL